MYYQQLQLFRIILNLDWMMIDDGEELPKSEASCRRSGMQGQQQPRRRRGVMMRRRMVVGGGWVLGSRRIIVDDGRCEKNRKEARKANSNDESEKMMTLHSNAALFCGGRRGLIHS